MREVRLQLEGCRCAEVQGNDADVESAARRNSWRAAWHRWCSTCCRCSAAGRSSGATASRGASSEQAQRNDGRRCAAHAGLCEDARVPASADATRCRSAAWRSAAARHSRHAADAKLSTTARPGSIARARSESARRNDGGQRIELSTSARVRRAASAATTELRRSTARARVRWSAATTRLWWSATAGVWWPSADG